MSTVILNNISKSFRDVVAVQDLNLEIAKGEFFSLLGPSGCGKTTTLRMIAGFDFPTSGSIHFGDQDVTYVSPNKRNTGMVFQSYALFPHMTVFDNVAFGLQARKTATSEIGKRVGRALELVELAEYARRKVTQLSGGQQQRVALARAIVIEPNILLLDEPLSNLDAKLREETREEIRALQKRLGITTIYVTHDQDEALSLSDRIAVLNQGICHQVGTPEEIYHFPHDRFVAHFVGDSNILEGTLRQSRNGEHQVEVNPDLRIDIDPSRAQLAAGQTLSLSIRPESLVLVNGTGGGANVFAGKIQRKNQSGAMVEYHIEARGVALRAKRLITESDRNLRVGANVFFEISPSRIVILE